jgi:anaerobic selenocysteine-containing dehydrogenase
MSNTKPGIDRRDFLKIASVSATGVVLGACHHGDPYALERPLVAGAENFARGEERLVASACAQCEAACGVHVRVVEGHAVKVNGNPQSPINRGGIGPRGLAGTEVLYDPDRVTGPMRRLVPRGKPALGDDAWEAVTWEVALEELGAQLMELHEDERGDRLAIVTGQERGMTRDLFARFAEAFGTTNFMDGRAKGMLPAAVASRLMQGTDDVPAYDWPHARLIVSLGAEVLSASCQKVHFSRSAKTSLHARARIVHVGSTRTTTAIQADDFLAVDSGTFGAFALGLANVIVRADLFDHDFIESHCTGFEDWAGPDGETHAGFRALLDGYTPEAVSAICGITAIQIETLALELAHTRPAFVVAGTEAYQSSNGVFAAMAVHALNALIGAIDRPGGLLTQVPPPTAAWKEFELDEYAEVSIEEPSIWSGLEPRAHALAGPCFDLFPVALLAAEEGRIDTLFLHYTNPLWSRPGAERWRAALARVPHIVSFSPVWDETSLEVADWILPDHTYLERWEDAAPRPSVGHAVFSLRQPAVEPLLDTRQSTDVLLALAKEIGEGVEEALAWKDSKDMVKKAIIGIYKAKRGSIVESKGSKFLKAFYAAGGWYDESYEFEDWERVITTESGRFEFAPPELFARLQKAEREDAASACLPHHEPLVLDGEPGRYPLLLVPCRPPTYPEGGGANLPLLTELRLRPSDRPWRTQVDLHPETAAEFDLEDGASIVIDSPVGSVSAYLRLDEGVRRGELRVPKGHGHSAMGRFAAGWGANVNELVSLAHKDTVFGTTPWIGTRVAVRRVEV